MLMIDHNDILFFSSFNRYTNALSKNYPITIDYIGYSFSHFIQEAQKILQNQNVHLKL